MYVNGERKPRKEEEESEARVRAAELKRAREGGVNVRVNIGVDV